MVHFENNERFASQMDARPGCTNGFTLMRQTMCIPALSRKIFIPLAMGYTHFNRLPVGRAAYIPQFIYQQQIAA
jgi:hypothetical protein